MAVRDAPVLAAVGYGGEALVLALLVVRVHVDGTSWQLVGGAFVAGASGCVVHVLARRHREIRQLDYAIWGLLGTSLGVATLYFRLPFSPGLGAFASGFLVTALLGTPYLSDRRERVT